MTAAARPLPLRNTPAAGAVPDIDLRKVAEKHGVATPPDFWQFWRYYWWKVAEKHGVATPPDFWQFWRYYWLNPNLRWSIELNFAEFPRYYRLWQQISDLAMRDAKLE